MLTDIFLCGIGLLTGMMNAIAGGGMLIGFPAMIAAGLTPLIANATGNIVILPGQLASAYGYRKYIHRIPRRYAWLLIPCIVGGAIGAMILRHTTGERFAHMVPGLILFAVLLFAVQPYIHFHLHRHMKKRSKSIKPLLFIAISFLPMAIYGGFFGAGLGFIMLAFLGFTSIKDVHQMNALKNIGNSVITIITIVFLLGSHLIDWHHGLAMAVGSTIGGYAGAVLAQRLSSHFLRIVVITIGLAATIYLGLRTY